VAVESASPAFQPVTTWSRPGRAERTAQRVAHEGRIAHVVRGGPELTVQVGGSLLGLATRHGERAHLLVGTAAEPHRPVHGDDDEDVPQHHPGRAARAGAGSCCVEQGGHLSELALAPDRS